MKIEHSNVGLQACHTFSSQCTVTVESEQHFRALVAGASATLEGTGDAQVRLRQILESLITHMLALLSGQASTLAQETRTVAEALTETGQPHAATSGGLTAPPRHTVELSWHSARTETVSESERCDFSSAGTVCTADGRVLNFHLGFSMARDEVQTQHVETQGSVVLRDPLVINFDGHAATLSGRRFAFDLDADGTEEWIDGLGRGSAYLAFDANGDGRINDGRELFGTGTGDGFADLARLDRDGNHWIDEADSGFDTLRVWTHDATGAAHLVTLREQGVGALYLGSAETPFALKDEDCRLQAQVRASGIYLTEDGRVGSLQQIDLAV